MFFGLFKCKHQAGRLIVRKDATYKLKDKDFTYVTYHLTCSDCGEEINITYAKINGSVAEFLNRGELV